MAEQRLPIVDSDDGEWGDIINQFLTKEHYDTGVNNAENGGHKTITIRAGTATAGTAPLKFTTGTNLGTPEAGAMEFSSSVLSFTPSSTRYSVLLSTIPDAQDISFGTTTGTKIGTATTQKLGFYNSTPIVQPTGDVATALSNLGLVASPTIAGSSVTGVVVTAPGSSTANIIQPSGDFKPLIVRGNASQTTTLQEWQNSGGSALASISSTGFATFSAGITAATHSSFGAAAVDTAGTLLSALTGTTMAAVINNQDTLTDGTLNSNSPAINGLKANAAASNGSNWTGQSSLIEVPTGNDKNFTGLVAGDGGATYHHGTGTITEANGVFGMVQNNAAGIITTSQAIRALTLNYGSGTITTSHGVSSWLVQTSGTNVVATHHGFHAYNPTVIAGSVTNNYGVYVEPQTTGTTINIGLVVGASTTNTVWLANTTLPTTEAGGIVFGSAKDTNLYRSAADTLKTDDSFTVGTNLTVTGTTALNDTVTIADAKNIALNTTTGTKIGTATTQKLGFYNSTPITQPANTVAINDVLVNLGLRASGAYSNFTTTVQAPAGTTAANTAPIKLTSGPLMTAPEAGAIEFLTDRLYFTQTSSTTRKVIAAFDDASGATGDVYYRDSSGHFVRLGVGSSNQVLSVASGLPAWRQVIFATSAKTADYTLTSGDTVVMANATSGNVIITLPVASTVSGYRFYVKRTDASANTVTIARSGSDTIDGATSQTLDAQYTSVTVVSDGSNWFII